MYTLSNVCFRGLSVLSPICACTHSQFNARTIFVPISSTSFHNFTSVLGFKGQNEKNSVLYNTTRFYLKPASEKKTDVVLENQNEVAVTKAPKKLTLTDRIIAKMPVPKRVLQRYKLLAATYYVYEQLSDEVNVEEFFTDFDMPDTFASWFTVMELHIYVLAARLFKHETYGVQSRDMLTDAFWNDVQYRAIKLGSAATLHRKKQLCILGYQFQAAFYGYDEGVQSNDMVLAAIVWRRFFGFECTDAEKIERVVKYIRVQLDYLNSVSFDDIVFNRQVLTIPLKNVQVG